jgi:effector-binding domain-containing protein
MTYECERIEQSAQPTLVVRRRSAVERLPEVLGPAWGLVMARAAEVGAEPVGAPFAAFFNTNMQDLDVAIGFVVDRVVAGADEVEAGEIPAGEAVQCMHVGPFDRLGEAYAAVRSWMGERGLEHAGPAFEHYLDDPAETPIEQVRTLIVIPVR